MMPTGPIAMSDAQLKAFLERVKADPSLQDRLQAANTAGAVVAIAKAEGFVISAEQLKQPPAEITEQELESVAAGALWDCSNGVLYTWNKGAPGCAGA